MLYVLIGNYYILIFLESLLYMYTNIAKNPLRTFLGLNREKNKNIKACPKKRSSYKKKRVYAKFAIVLAYVDYHCA